MGAHAALPLHIPLPKYGACGRYRGRHAAHPLDAGMRRGGGGGVWNVHRADESASAVACRRRGVVLHPDARRPNGHACTSAQSSIAHGPRPRDKWW